MTSDNKTGIWGVPSVAPWIKNLTAAAWVTMEVWVKGSGVATAAAQITAGARIQFMAQERPYDMGAAIKKKKDWN